MIISKAVIATLLMLLPSAMQFIENTNFLSSEIVMELIQDTNQDLVQRPILSVFEEWELCFPRDCESKGSA